MGRLTATKIKGLTARGLYGDGQSLYLNVSKAGTKSWIVRVQVKGGPRVDKGLGPWPLISIQEARDKSFEIRKQAYQGLDPIERGKGLTLREAVNQYLPQANIQNVKVWLHQLDKHVFPKMGNALVKSITRQDVLRIIGPMWTDQHETARKIKTKLKAVFGWALAHGHVSENVSNGELDGALPKANIKVEHHRTLPYQEISAAVELIERTATNESTKLCLLFLIHTAVRSGEARGATWKEIDLEKKVWEIPAERMKASQSHRVPLSDAAVDVLRRAKKLENRMGLVFPSIQKEGKPLTEIAFRRLLQKTGLYSRCVVHGFRSTFRAWATEETNINDKIIEMALAHRVGNAVQQAYDRTDLITKRRELMQRWSNFLTKKQAKVVAINQ